MSKMVVEMLLISGAAAALSATTTGIRRLLFKKEDYEKMAEIQAYNRQLMAATRQKDQKTLQKLQKKKEYIAKLNAEIGKKNLFTMFGSLIIFFTVYPILAGVFGTATVGVMPPGLDIPFVSENHNLGFYGWFILSFFGVGSPISKLLGVSMTGGMVNGEKKSKDKEQGEESG